jgi:hypothetical protein
MYVFIKIITLIGILFVAGLSFILTVPVVIIACSLRRLKGPRQQVTLDFFEEKLTQ